MRDLLVRLLKDVTRREEAISTKRVVAWHGAGHAIVRACTTEGMRTKPVRVVAVLRIPERRRGEVVADRQREVGREREVQVRAQSPTGVVVRVQPCILHRDLRAAESAKFELRHRQRAGRALGFTRHEVAQGITAAGNVHAVLVAVAVLERRRARIVPEVERRERVRTACTRRDRLDVAVDARAHGVAAPHGVCLGVPVVVLHLPLLGVHVPPRRADLAALGGDHDHAGRGVGAVERRGGRTTQHIERLDVVRVDVIQATGRRTAGAEGLLVAAAHAHAVDHVDRVVAERE